MPKSLKLQQHLPFTVCAEGCEAAEEQSDDEARTSQVPERRDCKTKVISQQYLPFTVCAAGCNIVNLSIYKKTSESFDSLVFFYVLVFLSLCI